MDYLRPAVTALIGKCLGIYSDKFAALRTFYSLILSDGGITDAAMNRLARLYDCVTHQSIINKLTAMAARYDIPMNSWREFSIVLDNVDIYVKPRQETATKSNTMHHMVQAIAVEDRVFSDHLRRQSLVDIDKLKPSVIYPTTQDQQAVRKLMFNKVLEILGTLPAAADLNIKVDHSHKYSAEMKKKSEQV